MFCVSDIKEGPQKDLFDSLLIFDTDVPNLIIFDYSKTQITF